MTPAALKDPTIRWFWTFAVAHFVVWTGVPWLTQSNASLDQIEMLYWGHEWQWGYYKHPPLPAWFAELSAGVFGMSLWPLFIVSQLCAVGSFWAAWKLGRELLPPWQALAAATLLETSWYHSYITTDFNNNTFPKLCWALFALGLYYGIQRGRLVYWAGAGLCLGVAMLSKYDAALLAVTMVAFSFINARARACWKTPGPYVLLAVSCLVFAPHAWWMVTNEFPTVQYALRTVNVGTRPNHWLAPLKFLGEQTIYHFPTLCVAALALGCQWRFKSAIPGTRFERDFVAFLALGPLLLAVTFAAYTGKRLNSYWGASMFTFFGVYLLATFRHFLGPAGVRRIPLASAAVGLIFAVLLGAHNLVGIRHRAKAPRNEFPGETLALRIEEVWKQYSSLPLKHVGGQWWPAGNVAAYHPRRLSVFAELDAKISPWLDADTIARDGMVVVWNCDDNGNRYDLRVQEQFPEAELLPPVEVAWDKAPNRPPLRIGVAIVPARDELRLADRRGLSDRIAVEELRE